MFRLGGNFNRVNDNLYTQRYKTQSIVGGDETSTLWGVAMEGRALLQLGQGLFAEM